jgi:ubiquinone/menaquinone biosynthesis C-methylase UbiE
MFTDPVKNLKALGLREDMIVADLGAGTGFYAIPLAHMVPNGKVYAVEIQRDFLHTIISKAKQEKLDNIEYLWGDVEKIGGTKIKDNVIDVVVISNILSQVEDKDKFIDEIKRILKKEGQILVIDKVPNSFLISSGHRTISKNDTRNLFGKKEFIYIREINIGEHHYGIILKR